MFKKKKLEKKHEHDDHFKRSVCFCLKARPSLLPTTRLKGESRYSHPNWGDPEVRSWCDQWCHWCPGNLGGRWPGAKAWAPFAWRQAQLADFDGMQSTNGAAFFLRKIMAQQIWFWSFGWFFFPKHHIETIRKTSQKKKLMRKVGPNPVTPKK